MNVRLIGSFLGALAQIQLRPSEKFYQNLVSFIFDVDEVKKMPRKHFISMILAISQLDFPVTKWMWEHLSNFLRPQNRLDIANLASIAHCVALSSVSSSLKENFDFDFDLGPIRSELEFQLNSIEWEKIPADVGLKVVTQLLLYENVVGFRSDFFELKKFLDRSLAALKSLQNPRSSKMQKKILEKFKKKFPAEKIIEEIFIPQIGSHVDALIKDEKKILQFDGPTHFYRNFPSGLISEIPTAGTRLNTKALQNSGYTVFRISLIKWSEQNFHQILTNFESRQ